jgi:hypothetical protein
MVEWNRASWLVVDYILLFHDSNNMEMVKKKLISEDRRMEDVCDVQGQSDDKLVDATSGIESVRINSPNRQRDWIGLGFHSSALLFNRAALHQISLYLRLTSRPPISHQAARSPPTSPIQSSTITRKDAKI